MLELYQSSVCEVKAQHLLSKCMKVLLNIQECLGQPENIDSKKKEQCLWSV